MREILRTLTRTTLVPTAARAAALVLLACGSVLSPTAAQTAPPTGVERTLPDIVLITSDDHRWDVLGAAGNPAAHTPALDRLAATGLYYPQATIHVSQCTPSRATLLTGLPPHLHGLHSVQYQEKRAQTAAGLCGGPTVPGLLRDAGYHTVLVGKWHLPPEPWECGFSEVRSWIPQGGAAYVDPDNLARGRSRTPVEVSGYTQEILAQDAIGFLRSETDARQPYFLWLAFTAPHIPYGPNPPRIRELYAGKTIADLLPPGYPKGEPTNPHWVEYYQAISHLDEQIGKVLDALAVLETQSARDGGGRGHTVIVFLGDNGYMMGERGLGLDGPAGKVVPYESSLRVPLIVAGVPGLRGTDASPVSSLDLPPTLVALAGITPPASWPGRDLVAAHRGGEPIEEAFSEWSDDHSRRFGPLAFRAVRTARYKLIDWQSPDKPDELYDLISDPHESRNRIADPTLAGVAEDLAGRLHAWRALTRDPTLPPSTHPSSRPAH